MKLRQKRIPGQCDAMRCKEKATHYGPRQLIGLCDRHYKEWMQETANADLWRAAREGESDVATVVAREPAPGHAIPPPPPMTEMFPGMPPFESMPPLEVRDPAPGIAYPPATSDTSPVVVPKKDLPDPVIMESSALKTLVDASRDLAQLDTYAFVAELKKDAEAHRDALKMVQDFEIGSSDEFKFAERILQEAQKDWKEYEYRRTSFTRPANAIVKRFSGWFSGSQVALKMIETNIKGKLRAYRHQQAAEQQRLLAQAQAAEKPAEIKAAVIAASQAIPEATTTQYVDNWVFEVTDEDRVPREYLQPNLAAIKVVVKLTKSKTKIPGVRVWNEQIVKGRSA